ncbi:MAG: hypothetical protein FJ109_07940 [Deltaproteobacteria bacterium]|nr:hypothetical protein [Deltaproteobacteria bacterium]
MESRLLTGGIALLAGLCLAPCVLSAQEAALDVTERNNKAVALSQEGKLMEGAIIWLDLIDEVGAENPYLWGFHMNVGRNFQKLALFPEAWWHLQQSVSLNPGGMTRAVEWKDEVEKVLRQTHRKVTVIVGNHGGRIRFLHGTRPTWYKAPLEWWFKPGEEGLDVAADGIEASAQRFPVGLDTSEVVLRLDAPAVVEPIKPPEDGAKAEPARRRQLGPWFLVGGAILLAGAGGATWWVATANLENEKSGFQDWVEAQWPTHGGKIKAGEEDVAKAEWDRRISDSVTPYEVSSYALWGAAGAAAAGGILWLVADASRGKGEEDPAHPAFVPLVLPGGAGAAIQLPF